MRKAFVVLLFSLLLPFAANATCSSNEIDVAGNGTQCETAKFSVTTANDTNNVYFNMSAAGIFYVDWGDGNVQTIDRTNDTTNAEYSHNYSPAGSYTIRFGGVTTGYNPDQFDSVLTFYKETGGTQRKITSIGGSLGAIFPTLGSADGQQPRFRYTFQGTSITQIPENLFSGVSGGVSYMFEGTFRDSLITSIPENLFANVQPAYALFHYTFFGTPITSIPENLFASIHGNAVSLFDKTFLGCTSLTNIPAGLFRNVSGGASSMFRYTFYNCQNLTSIPANLFSSVTDGAEEMFYLTFSGSGITTVPQNLFGNITTPGIGMFFRTFSYCTGLTSIQSGVFGALTTGADRMFQNTFLGCTSLASIPDGLFANITTGAANLFDGAFQNCTSLTSIPANLFAGVRTAGYQMFWDTFSGCTNLSGYIPPNAFAGLIANGHPTATEMWRDTFNNTALATSCPSGIPQYTTGYESYWNGKVSCGCAPGNALDDGSCGSCPNGTYSNGSVIYLDPSTPGTSYTSDSNNMTWNVTFPYGNVSGTAVCNSTPGASYAAKSPYEFEQNTEGAHCWCRMNNPGNSASVYIYEYNSANTCAVYCASDCAYDVSENNVFRRSVFMSSSCPVCTGLPANAHYTDSGTTATNCPWQCDATNSVVYNNACHARCPVNEGRIHADQYSHPLFADKTNMPSPVLHIQYTNGTMCYGYLEPGFAPAGEHGIHIFYEGAVYHAVNPGD